MSRSATMSIADDFESRMIPEPNSGCWLWLDAPTGQLGHGQMKINGKARMASHIALELAGRPLPAGMFACIAATIRHVLIQTIFFSDIRKTMWPMLFRRADTIFLASSSVLATTRCQRASALRSGPVSIKG